MRRHASWLMAAACVLALAACKKSSTGNGMGTGGVGTATGGFGAATGGTTGPATGGTAAPVTGGTAAPATGGTSGGTAGKGTAGMGTAGMGTAGMGTAGMGTAGSSAGGGSAMANITGFMGGMAAGTATFTQTGADVKLDVMLTAGCPMGGALVHIHQGTSCTDATSQGGHWDTPMPGVQQGRGEGIPNITCNGMTGMTTVTRMPTDPNLAWTVGGPMTTNVVGHVIVVHSMSTDGGSPPRIGCGVIMMK